MRGRVGMPAIGVSMAYPDFRRRLETVLDRKVDRRPLSKIWTLPLAALFLVLTIVAGSLRPFDARVVAAEPPSQTDAAPTTATPVQKGGGEAALIRGFVTDWNSQPIAGANVLIQLQASAGDDSTPPQTLQTWKVTTNKLGAYEIDGGPMDALPRRPEIRIRASADGFITQDRSWSVTKAELAVGKRIGPTNLWKKKIVVGRVIGANGHPVAGHIFAAGHNGDVNYSWWQSGEVAADGRFDLFTPREMDIELLVFGKDHAPTRVAVEQNVSNLAEIRVSKGTVIAGQLLNRENRPVAGVVIAMTSLNDSKVADFSFSAESATITDVDGRFKLPPTKGECHVWAAKSAESMENGKATIKGITPPPVIPITVNLPENDAVTEVTIALKESDVVEMSGTVRWENGEPVAGLEVNASHGDANLAKVKTDAAGKYKLTVPIAVHRLHLMAIGAKNHEGVWFMAHGECGGVPSLHPQIQTFEDLNEDKRGINWVLKPHKK